MLPMLVAAMLFIQRGEVVERRQRAHERRRPRLPRTALPMPPLLQVTPEAFRGAKPSHAAR
jgi:hypothetical protein